MANYKRKKCRRKVRCSLCTDARVGNSQKDGKRRKGSREFLEVRRREERDGLNEASE